LTRILAEEEETITAIAVRPGAVDTDMQTKIRKLGETGMPTKMLNLFMENYRRGKLIPPALPGRVLAKLALFAPREWSGRFVSWDDEDITALVNQYSGGGDGP
jgi:NAD(P)-dependent dehydrogenase (short-subunit alcohol dehydrogenase family)